ncbi:DUF1995 family protein [Synechococcus sp. M16CYN]|uniref:DUF1995 family protein n=1 Tax=Synechococcus sp. M16CYN TaxID=3103139 RepID=UPI0032552845
MAKQDSLPADLLIAEHQLQDAISAALATGKAQRWSANLCFENLRVLPVALRLARALVDQGFSLLIAWPDAGTAALARREADDLSALIIDFKRLNQIKSSLPDARVLLAVAPQPFDYETFQSVCDGYSGPVVMLNGRLEDAAVGIGSVVRKRRRSFILTWHQAYWLQPLEGGALMRSYPKEWTVFRLDQDGYRQLSTFNARPDAETIFALLAKKNQVT